MNTCYYVQMGTREMIVDWELKRMMRKVQVTDSCWVWMGATSHHGYAMTTVAGKQRVAHRAFYELIVGEIPEGLVLDHLCHGWDQECRKGSLCPHRRCVNPDHLEPLTS